MSRLEVMSNKMKKYFLLWFIVLFLNELHAFVPKERDFANHYQYLMHQSWLKKSGLKVNVPAGFAEEKIMKLFRDQNYQIMIDYYWENWKIYEQTENLIDYCNFDYHEVIQQLHFVEIFIYRLNCAEKNFLVDLYHTDFLLIYNDKRQQEALDFLWHEYQTSRFNVIKIELSSQNNRIGFIITSTNNENFEIYFPETKDIQSQLKELRLVETIREKELKKLKQKVKDWKKEQADKPKEKKLVIKDENKANLLIQFIRDNYNVKQNKELLHNKITNPEKFIYKELSEFSIRKEKNIYTAKIQTFADQFISDLQIKTITNHDGIDIVPVSNYEVKEKIVTLGTGEKIDLTKLTETEIDGISPYLCQLLYEHRAIGTDLLNFLLIHDDTPSTLVVHTNKRELFEMYSYANMILLLHNYWMDREVYYTVKDFKKVNGYIEFTGFLAAVSKHSETYDFAEIKYQLNEDFRIQLAMMILYPELSIIE